MDEPSVPAVGVTVLTLTRRRPELVQRAMRSVHGQRTRHRVHHVVLIDDCPRTRTALAAAAPDYPGVEVRYRPRAPHEVSGPGRSSRLRNEGARQATDPWVAFLDDDNEWTADHLESLVACVQTQRVRAAYSHVQLLNRDGTPYLEPRWPWARTPAEAERIYQDYVALGLLTPGSSVVGTRPGRHDEPADTSSWLFARELLLEVPFAESFSATDAENLVGEDDKMFQALLARGERVACTRRPTLRYYLGGYSNNPDGRTDETFSWSTGPPSGDATM